MQTGREDKMNIYEASKEHFWAGYDSGSKFPFLCTQDPDSCFSISYWIYWHPHKKGRVKV